MHWDTSSEMLPGVIGFFNIIHTPPWRPSQAGADPSLVTDFMALLFSSPVLPSRVNALQNPGSPPPQVHQPFLPHVPTGPSCMAHFLSGASSKSSSQGTVSSSMISCLVGSETMIIAVSQFEGNILQRLKEDQAVSFWFGRRGLRGRSSKQLKSAGSSEGCGPELRHS